MKKIVALLAAIVLMFGACSTNSPDVSDAQSADDAYIQTLHQLVPQTTSVPDETLIHSGHQICDAFEDLPMTHETLLGAAEGFVQGSDGLFDYEDAGAFFGAATAAYCPDVNEEMNDLIGGNT